MSVSDPFETASEALGQTIRLRLAIGASYISDTLSCSWTEGEMRFVESLESIGASVSDHEAFMSAMRQTFRNIPLFSAQAFVVAFLPGLLGYFGAGIGYVGTGIAALFVAMLALFIVQLFLTLGMGLFLLLAYPFSKTGAWPRWVAAVCVLNLVDILAYSSMAYYVGWVGGWWSIV